MAVTVYLGDEVSAAGFRLAGVPAQVPAPGSEAAALASARQSAALVLLDAAVAARIEPGVLRAALAAPAPLVCIVPDLDGAAPLPDVGARLRAALGLEG